MSIVIKAENISKAYRLGSIGTGTLSYDIEKAIAKIRGKEDRFLKIDESNEQFQERKQVLWSLKDIDFEIEQGDILGIIGRNGAGKSTLLKILSKVTSPTSGRIFINGRIASLLEVGTGFHPELTGRENIFLNGSILGMRKSEIKQKLDAIVDFSGVEKYINTPVKRYSTGMYVRLAFAVAAFLEPEILIVDEVLAVGDSEFQRKCLGRMKEVSLNNGRTILFVSHNMAAVKQLCGRGIVLDGGILAYQGSQTEAVNYYQKSCIDRKSEAVQAFENENIRILNFSVRSLKEMSISVSTGIDYEVSFYNKKENCSLDATFELRNLNEVVVFHHGTAICNENGSKRGTYTVTGTIPPFLLNAGIYTFTMIFGENQRYTLFEAKDIFQFEILNEAWGSSTHILPGFLRLNTPFNIRFENKNHDN